MGGWVGGSLGGGWLGVDLVAGLGSSLHLSPCPALVLACYSLPSTSPWPCFCCHRDEVAHLRGEYQKAREDSLRLGAAAEKRAAIGERALAGWAGRADWAGDSAVQCSGECAHKDGKMHCAHKDGEMHCVAGNSKLSWYSSTCNNATHTCLLAPCHLCWNPAHCLPTCGCVRLLAEAQIQELAALNEQLQQQVGQPPATSPPPLSRTAGTHKNHPPTCDCDP